METLKLKDGYSRLKNPTHRTIKAAVTEVKRLYPTEPVFRNGKRIAGFVLAACLSLWSFGCGPIPDYPTPCQTPADLVTVAQYPDGSFSVDVYGADGELETTAHLPANARMSDMFPAKGDQ